VDSTGIKAVGEGEGEWNARKHGGSKRRVWRKTHIGIDEETLEVWAAARKIKLCHCLVPSVASAVTDVLRHV
jgi:hypothetical protein